MHSTESPSLSEAYNESEVAAPEESRRDERLRWTRSDASSRGSYFENRPAIKKRSVGKRMVSATTRFVVAVLIGVAATLAWQTYGDQARAALASWNPSLAWINPPPATQPAAAAAASPADLAQQLRPIASEITAMRQDLVQLATKQEQLAANQGQLAQGLSTLSAIEHEVGVKVSSLVAPKPVHPQPHPAAQLQPRQPAPRALLPPEETERR